MPNPILPEHLRYPHLEFMGIVSATYIRIHTGVNLFLVLYRCAGQMRMPEESLDALVNSFAKLESQ